MKALRLLMICALIGSNADLAAEGAAEPSEQTAEILVEVLYLTNRGRRPGEGPVVGYTGERGGLHSGVCQVAFSPIALMNDLAEHVPFYVPTESRRLALEEDPNINVFWVRLKQRTGESPGRPVLLLVHGYNYGFERACRMGADLQRRLEGEAEVVLFSWPSDGNPANYLPDQVDVEWSVPFLARTIQQIRDHMGPETPLHLLAHSIGSRGAFYALDRLNTLSETQPAIDQFILMAPDFDAATFVDAFDWIRPLVGQVTLYASVNDTPLALSEQLNGYPRLGQAGASLTLIDGMDTIDVSEAGRYQFTGHEYHLYHPRVGADLAELIATRKPAADRSGLASRTRDGVRYWAITGPDVP